MMESFDGKTRITQVIDLTDGGGIPDFTGETDVRYSRSFSLKKDPRTGYALGIKLSSAGTPAVKIEIEQGRCLPETEGESSPNYCVPMDVAPICGQLAVKTFQIFAVSPNVSPFARIKISGLAGGAADVSFDILELYVTSTD
jgi:hypothetical protein